MSQPLTHYHIFYQVLSEGSMSQAGKQLFLSQPAVSMAIAKLEETLGYDLLIRTPKGVIPTQQGAVLYRYLDQVYRLIDRAHLEIERIQHLDIGEIKIGASDTLSSAYLLPYLEHFNQLYPNINIKVTNRTSDETIKLLKAGSVDLAFINLPFEDEAIEIYPCLEVRDVLIGGTRYQTYSETGITLKELASLPLMMLEGMSHTRRYINDFALRNGQPLEPKIELGSLDLLTQFARINLGVAFVIKEFTRGAINDQDLFEIPLIPAIPSRSIGLIYLKGMPQTHAVHHFIEMIKQK